MGNSNYPEPLLHEPTHIEPASQYVSSFQTEHDPDALTTGTLIFR
jgi:hypothetical protein